MKLVHVVPTYLPATRYGGPIYSVHGLCAALVRAGHEVEVLTTSVDGPHDSDVPMQEPVLLDGVTVRYFRSRVGRRLYYAPAMELALRTALDGAAMLHVHSVFLWPTNTAARIARALQVPYVVSPRGMLVPELIARKSSLLKQGWLALFESATLAGARHVHLTSTRELDDARRLPVPLPSPVIVPNGVDGPPEDDAPFGSERVQRIIDGAPYVLFLGRLHWKKGLERTLRAVAGTRMRLVVCGPDDEGYAAKLTQLASELGLSAQLELVDAVEGDDRWALLSGARVVVLASDNENFGNVVPEAMWMGRPIVVTTGVGASEIVQAAGAGTVCNPEVEALRSALLRPFEELAYGEQLGRAGASYARAWLSWDRVAERMLAAYGRT